MELQVETVVLTSGVLAAGVLELFKWVYRTWIVKNPGFDFPVKFYAFMLPVLTFLVEPALALLGVGTYTLPTNWQEWLVQLLVVVISSAVALGTYAVGIAPMKEYSRSIQ